MPDDDQGPLLRAIAKALANSDLSQRELGVWTAYHEDPKADAYTQQTVAGWLAGRAYLNPRRVFAIEQALDLRPGTLSKIEGYAPVDASVVVTPEEAIEADPDISDEQASMLSVQLTEARRLTRARRAGRSQR